MCLLVHQPASTTFTRDFLLDVYASNSDGFGVMFAEAGRLVTRRFLPKTGDAFVSLFQEHAAGRECIWHVRMRTHGDVDLANCHPYAVTPRVALAHNGILSTGNSWDASKSDTWHFIRNIVEPAIAYNEALVLDPTWQAFIAKTIGSGNKFGIMTAAGDAVVINRESGVEFAGAWLSNTYAWPAASYGVGVGVSRSRVWEYDWSSSYSVSSSSRSSSSRSSSSRSSRESMTQVWRAARNCYVRGTLTQWVADAPAKAAALLEELEGDSSAGDVAWSDPELAVDWIADHLERDGRLSFDDHERAVADY